MGVNIQGYGSNSGSTQQVDPLFAASRISVRPEDLTLYGWYRCAGQSVITFASPQTNAPIFSFRYAPSFGPTLCLVKKFVVNFIYNTSDAAGDTIALYVGRQFTASDSAGTAIVPFGDNGGKLRTAYRTSGVTDARILTGTSLAAGLTAGTRTLDTQPISYLNAQIDNPVSGLPVPVTQNMLLNSGQSHPLVLRNNEGLVLEMTTQNANNGTSIYLYISMAWAEVGVY